MSQSGPLNIRNASNTVTSIEATAPLTANGVSGTPEVGDVIIAITTPLAVSYGGTGQSTYIDGQLLIGNTTGNTLTKSTLTAGSGIGIANAGGSITITNTDPGSAGVTSLTGTANQVLVNGTTGAPQTGALTLTLPQSIASANSPTFSGLLLNGSGSGTVSILPQAAAGTFNFNLPITAGTSGYFLTSAGGGASPMTWTNPASSLVTSIAGTANQIAASASVGAVTLSLTNGISLGSYQAIAPPVGGMIVPGVTAFGASSVATGQVQISTALAYGLYLDGTQTAIDGSSFQSSLLISGILQPTSGSVVSSGAIISPSFITPAAQTTSFGFGLYIRPTLNANAGTITTFAQISLETASGATGTITTHIGLRVPALGSGTNRYGLFVSNPSGGTVATAAYLENLSVGYTGISPPASGMICAGQSAVGANTVTTNNQFAVTSTMSHTISARGTQTDVDSLSHQHAYQANGGMNPTGGAVLCAAFTDEVTYGANAAQTITSAVSYHSSPAFSGNAGTISSFAGFFFDGGSSGAGTITTVYGCYLTNPAIGTNKFAAYMDNLAVGSNAAVPPSLGATIKGQTLLQYGGAVFGLSNTPSLILGTNTTLGGVIKLWGTTAAAYSIIQCSTTNLHLDSNNSGATDAIYLNHYSTLANTYIQDAGGQIGLGTLTPTSGAVVTISGANATTSTRRSLYVTAPTGGGSSNQAIYADDVTIGYTTGQPATNGLLVSGISSIGTVTYENCRLTIQNSATDYYNLYLKGTLVSYDAGQVVANAYLAAGLNPTLGSAVAAGIYANNSFIAPTAQTITAAASFYARPFLSSNIGTITTLGEFTASGGSGSAGTITNHMGFYAQAITSGTNRYGGYFTNPSGGTIAAALYADNMAIGSAATPASSTGLSVAGKVLIGTNTLGSDTLSNDLQLGTIGTSKGMSIAMTNTFARMREVATVNRFAITTNYSISPNVQDNATYNSWIYSMLSGATTTGFCRWDNSPPGTTATTTFMNLSSDPVLAVGTLSFVANAAIPFQCSALLTTDIYFGANKAGSSAALFGFANGHATFGTATVIRCVTTDPIDVFVNSTSRSVRFDSSQRVLTTGTVGLGYGVTTTGMLSSANIDSLCSGSQAGYLSTVYLSAAANANGYYMRQARGSQASPTATNLNDALGNIFAQGYGATGFSAFATGITLYAEQTFTDTANGAGMIFYSTLTGTAVLNNVLQLSANGNVVCGGANGAAISTSATYGFFYLPTCAGTPTGIPEAYTGRIGMVYDSTNNKLYAYNGAWKSVTLA